MVELVVVHSHGFLPDADRSLGLYGRNAVYCGGESGPEYLAR